jgi:surface antigen
LEDLVQKCLLVVCVSFAFLVQSSIIHSASAASGVNPFPRSVGNLTEGEAEAIKSAIRQALDRYKSGEVIKWTASDSKRSGEVTIIETYEQKGRRCASVQNKFVGGVGNTYRLPFCEVSDGSWKVNF